MSVPRFAYVKYVDDKHRKIIIIEGNLLNFLPKNCTDFIKNKKYVCNWPIKEDIIEGEESEEMQKIECIIYQLATDESEINTDKRDSNVPDHRLLSASEVDEPIKETEKRKFDQSSEKVQEVKRKRAQNLKTILNGEDKENTSITTEEKELLLITTEEKSRPPCTEIVNLEESSVNDRSEIEKLKRKLLKAKEKLKRKNKLITFLQTQNSNSQALISNLQSSKDDTDEINKSSRKVQGIFLDRKQIEYVMEFTSRTKFVRELIRLIWTDPELKGKSVTGRKCPSKPFVISKPALVGTDKYEALKELFNEKFMRDKVPDNCMESSKGDLNKTLGIYIGEIDGKEKRKSAKKDSSHPTEDIIIS